MNHLIHYDQRTSHTTTNSTTTPTDHSSFMGPIGAIINSSPPIIHIHTHPYISDDTSKEPLFDAIKLNCNECALSSLYILAFSMSHTMEIIYYVPIIWCLSIGSFMLIDNFLKTIQMESNNNKNMNINMAKQDGMDLELTNTIKQNNNFIVHIANIDSNNNNKSLIENNKIELTEITTTETALITYNVETNLISKSDNYTLKNKNNSSQTIMLFQIKTNLNYNKKTFISRNDIISIIWCYNILLCSYISGPSLLCVDSIKNKRNLERLFQKCFDGSEVQSYSFPKHLQDAIDYFKNKSHQTLNKLIIIIIVHHQQQIQMVN